MLIRYLHKYYPLETRFSTVRDVIILLYVLADLHNIEINDFRESVVETVNGSAVSSLEEFKNILYQEAPKSRLMIKFWRQSLPLLLDQKKADIEP